MPELPQAPGAYVLLVALERPLALTPPGLHGAVLGPGSFAYCGSARGPGGIRARVRRHMRDGKRPHWHIDHLTEAGCVTAVHGVPGGRECELLDRILAVPGATVPVPGFGSTDCRRCPAHLLRLPGKIGGDTVARWTGKTTEGTESC